ncbi:putative ORfan [Saudi moumouvirus]|nr:putative ORfan [Saudi moumouvirus]
MNRISIPVKYLSRSMTNITPKTNQILSKKRNFDTVAYFAMFTAIYSASIIAMYDSDDDDY